MINGQQVTDTIHGLTGVGFIQTVDQIPTSAYGDIIKIVVQIGIGVMTLWNLWKNRNKTN